MSKKLAHAGHDHGEGEIFGTPEETTSTAHDTQIQTRTGQPAFSIQNYTPIIAGGVLLVSVVAIVVTVRLLFKSDRAVKRKR